MSSSPSTVVLAISRQLGSGGSYVGQAVARRLGLKYVDRQILDEAARMLGVGETDVAQLEERVASLWMRVARVLSLESSDAPYVPPGLSATPEDAVFEAESRIVREIADREDAVIVGRGCFHMLRRHPGVIRLFLQAPVEWRVHRVMEVYRVASEQEAREMIARSDVQRGQFVERLTHRAWSDTTQYDLCLNTGSLGLDAVIDLACSVVSSRLAALGRPPHGTSS